MKRTATIGPDLIAELHIDPSPKGGYWHLKLIETYAAGQGEDYQGYAARVVKTFGHEVVRELSAFLAAAIEDHDAPTKTLQAQAIAKSRLVVAAIERRLIAYMGLNGIAPTSNGNNPRLSMELGDLTITYCPWKLKRELEVRTIAYDHIDLPVLVTNGWENLIAFHDGPWTDALLAENERAEREMKAAHDFENAEEHARTTFAFAPIDVLPLLNHSRKQMGMVPFAYINPLTSALADHEEIPF